jgi:aminoglycoside 3-N-acetyltransferase
MHSRSQLADHFRALGVRPGDTIMLHSSVRSVGPVAGGPDQIHLALKDALTDEGTILVFAGCPRHYDEVGRGNLTADEEREVLELLPPFDPLTARAARDHGILVEFLRTYPGTRVNPHVARFLFWGKHSDHLIAPQPWNYGFGAGSALERFVQLDGKILLLGSDHDTVTFLHYVEHVTDFPDKRIARFQVPVEENGGRVWRAMEEVNSNDGAHANWSQEFFATIVDAYLVGTGNRGGLIGNAESYLMNARALQAFAAPIMQAVAADVRALHDLRAKATPIPKIPSAESTSHSCD